MAEITDYERRIAAEHAENAAELENMLGRVQGGEMLAYIIGEWYFYRRYFKINRDCLIPRPDTERVVELAADILEKDGKIADLCTGCGCIGLSVLDERPDCRRALLVDISGGALAAAAENAGIFGFSDRAELRKCDILTENPLGDEKFSLIISNPPYIKTAVVDESEELAAEPRAALDGGADGLIFYRRIVGGFAENLKDGGSFIFEIGYDEADGIKSIAAENGFGCKVFKDYSGNDRVALLKRAF